MSYRRSLDSNSHSDEISRWETSMEEERAGTGLASEYLRSLKRHKALIALTAFALAAIGILLQLTTQPVYRTRTSLDIQSANNDFMDLRTIQPNAATPTDTLVQTQVKLLESDSLQDRVQAKLASEQHPEYVLRNDLLSRMERKLHLGGKAEISYDALVAETAASVKVKPMGITQLVEVTCDSWNADFAASYCNTLTDQFREVDLDSRGDQAKRTSDWLVKQAADVRSKAQESEQRLIAATGGNGLMLSAQPGSVGEDGLRSMQSELVRAQAARMEAQAQLETRKSITNEGPISNESAAYSAEKVHLADLQTQVAALVPPLTEDNPRVIHLRSEIRQVETNLDKEVVSSDQRLQNQYSAAKHHEDLLTATYRAMTGNVSSDLQKSAGVDVLRREVQSEQQLYQTLLQRAKEAGFASAMPASTIRIVDEAKVPRFPVLPKPMNNALIGLFIGGIAGIFAAVVKDRGASLLRLPGETERLLGTQELGVIPSPLASGSRSYGSFRPLGKDALGINVGGASPGLTAGWDKLSLVAEAYRNTTISILNAPHQKSLRSFVIASPSSGEGKTTITCNIGIALSKAKLRVVMIDGDLRKPSLHKAFGVSNKIGLRQILGGEHPEHTDFCLDTAFENLSLIPAGSGTAATVELLHSGEFSGLMQLLSPHFDVVLVDTPPMLHMADARLLSREVEGTILVFRSGVTSREDALTARSLLARDQALVVGSILNDFNPRAAGKTGYYDSYSAYQEHAEERQSEVSL